VAYKFKNGPKTVLKKKKKKKLVYNPITPFYFSLSPFLSFITEGKEQRMRLEESRRILFT
jgi:hypothetical protein